MELEKKWRCPALKTQFIVKEKFGIGAKNGAPEGCRFVYIGEMFREEFLDIVEGRRIGRYIYLFFLNREANASRIKRFLGKEEREVVVSISEIYYWIMAGGDIRYTSFFSRNNAGKLRQICLNRIYWNNEYGVSIEARPVDTNGNLRRGVLIGAPSSPFFM